MDTADELPSVNSYSSRKKWEEICWKRIRKSEKLLELLATPYERRNLVLRAAVISRINAKRSYREIGKELWLSSQTISGIKKAMERNGYRSYRERSKTERKKKVYSSGFLQTKKKMRGKLVRTKYGTLRLPY